MLDRISYRTCSTGASIGIQFLVLLFFVGAVGFHDPQTGFHVLHRGLSDHASFHAMDTLGRHQVLFMNDRLRLIVRSRVCISARSISTSFVRHTWNPASSISSSPRSAHILAVYSAHTMSL